MKTIKSVNSILKYPLVLVIMPILLASWLFFLFELKGPQWILMPQDLGYTYILNGLNVLLGRELGVLIHPAITVSYVHAGIIYLFYLISGTGELQTHVVANAETYSVVISHFTTLGIASCAGFLGWSVYRLTGRPKFGFIAVLGIFLIPILYWPLNAFGCPESFLLMIIMLMTGLSCLYASDRVSVATYILCSSSLCALAIGVKFIALPMLALPFFLPCGLKAKAFFCGVFFFALAVVFAPAYLDPVAFVIFKSDVGGLIGSAQLERNAAAGSTFLLRILGQSFNSLTQYPVFLSVVIVQLLIFPFIRPRYFFQDTTLYKTARVNVALLGTILIAIGFLALRPKVHYYVTYASIQGVTIALSLFLLQKRGFWIDLGQSSKKGISSAVVLILAGLVIKGIYPVYNNLKYLNNHRVQAIRANEVISKEQGNYALITAIPSSHVSTAYEHANQTSRFNYWLDIEKQMKPNWFNYTFDGKSAWDRSRQTVSFQELSHLYEKTLFWMSREQFTFNEDGSSAGGILSPRAQFKVLVGRARAYRELNDGDWPEILAELQGIEIVSVNDRKRQGLRPNCSGVDNCYTLTPTDQGLFQPTAMALWFKYDLGVPNEAEKQRVNYIHKAWRLEGLNKEGSWQSLKIMWDQKLLARDSQWVFKIEAKRKYRKFRLRGKPRKYCLKALAGSGEWIYCKKNDNLINVRIYAKPPKTPPFRVLPKANYFYSKSSGNKKKPHPLISAPVLWESSGPFPVLLNKKIDPGDYIKSYTLGCGAEGNNGTDSTTRMPVSWKLFGIDKNGVSVLLDTKTNVTPWKPMENRTFFINKQTFNINKLVLLVEKPHLSTIARISLFLLDRSPPQRPQKKLRSSINIIQGPFWEKAGGVPVALTRKLKTGREIESYELGAANHGKNGIDSTSRMPLSWKLFGQLKSGNWILLDSQQDVKPWAPNEIRTYYIQRNNTSIKPIKIVTIKLVVEKALDGKVTRISNLKLNPLIPPDNIFSRSATQRIFFNGVYYEQGGLDFPAGIEMQLERHQIVGSYVLKADKHGKEAAGRMPRKWVFQGFDVYQRKWIDLHRVYNASQWKRKEERRYLIPKPFAYPIYRLHVLETQDRGVTFRISSFGLYSPSDVDPFSMAPKKQKMPSYENPSK